MDVIKLLQSKNRCLQRLLNLSRDFLAGSETPSTASNSGELNGLPEFQAERDAIFKALDLYDRKITSVIASLPSENRTQDLVLRIQTEIDEKERLTREVLLLDNRIMALIEEQKKKIFEDIARSHKSETLVKKFKSSWVPESGEEFDGKL